MHICIIEKEHFERKWLIEALVEAFPGVSIEYFRNVGDFLMRPDDLPKIGVLIMEHHLPLSEPREDLEVWVKKLTNLFPETVADWHHWVGGERVVKHLRKIGNNVPIILYTHSDSNYVQDILKETNVHFCYKKETPDNIICLMLNLLVSQT